MSRNILIKGNSKMGDDVYIFNLPPLSTCTPSDWCRKNCYALKGNFKLANAVEAAEWRFSVSLENNFSDLVVEEIKHLEKRLEKGQIKEFYIRVHSSGDFYSKEYVKKWINIADRCPEVLFRTTTKRTDLADIIRHLDSLPNFIVRESLDPSQTISTMRLSCVSAVSTTPGVLNNEMLKCVNDCQKCGYQCWKKRVDNYFDPR